MRKTMKRRTTILLLALGQLLSVGSAEAKPKKKPAVKHVATTAAAKSHAAAAKGHADEARRGSKLHRKMAAEPKHVAARGRKGAARHYYGERFTASSFADDITLGDMTAGEDPVVRAAA